MYANHLANPMRLYMSQVLLQSLQSTIDLSSSCTSRVRAIAVEFILSIFVDSDLLIVEAESLNVFETLLAVVVVLFATELSRAVDASRHDEWMGG
jgi:hypothetical protein